jgi:sulfite reductase alpha subunit-like flavoprotein
VAETPEKETQGDKQPEAAQQGASSRVPAIVVSLSALAVISAATAYSLPNFNRFAAQSPHETASVPIPDPVVSATLKDIQLSQQQNAAVLVSLTQSSATQQADLKRISRQLSSLAAQADALQSAVTPVTTSSIPQPNAPARVARRSRKQTSRLPKPVGPVSVGGAPLSPAPAPRSGAG